LRHFVVERKDLTGNLKVSAHPAKANTVIVSGTLLHSSWGIQKIKIEPKNHALVLKMYMVHVGCGRDLIDQFSYHVEIPNETSIFLLGNEGYVLWKRPGSLP
jgi:hypothetical protein